MSAKTLNLAGFICYWILSGESEAAPLKEGLEKLGLQQYMPKPTSEKVAMRKALDVLHPSDPEIRIIDVKGLPGHYTVTRKTTNEHGGNRHENLVTGHVSSETCVPTNGDDPHDLLFNSVPKWDEVQEEYDRLRDTIPRDNLMTSALGIASYLKGISLKPGAGFFWIPKESLETWDAVSDVFIQANPRNRMQRFITAMDERSLAACVEALTAEIEESVSHTAGRLDVVKTMKGTETVEREAMKTLEKVESFEKTLGVALKDLTEIATAAKGNAASAVFSVLTAKNA